MGREHRDDSAGSYRTVWAQLSMSNLPRWARWLYTAWVGIVLALVAAHLAAPALPAPLGAHLNAAVTRALPLAILMLVFPLVIANIMAVRAHPHVLGSWGWRLVLLGALMFLPAGIYVACVLLVPSLARDGWSWPALAAACVALAGGVLSFLGSVVVVWEALRDTIRDLAQQARTDRGS